LEQRENLFVSRKVLIIVENAPVPMDPRVWKEATSLQRNGYSVAVISKLGKGYEKYHEVIDSIHIYRHPMPKEGDSASAYLWEYACALFWEFSYSCWIFFRHGFQVIQGCNPPDDIFLVALPFKLFGVKYIFDHHDVIPELFLTKFGNKGTLYRAQVLLEKLTFWASDVVLATNESYREIAINRGGKDPADVFVVRNGPVLGKFKAVAPIESLKRGKAFLVGYVGFMSSQDGLDILVDVARHIKDMGRRDIQFTCIGTGSDFPRLRKMVQDKGLDDLVEFTGRIPDAELLGILSTADVCVNPDVPCEMNDISTMQKIMEYMALGKPIVQFDMKEGKFSAGEASLYADKHNQIPDFAAKILWLLDNPDERKRMGEFGRKRVEEELAWDYSIPKLLEAYKRCFDKRGRVYG
jgi:glycosyltransferase involved in cell wall biosynthesis